MHYAKEITKHKILINLSALVLHTLYISWQYSHFKHLLWLKVRFNLLTWITFLNLGFFPATSFVFPHFRCILESYSQHSINASKNVSGTSYRPKTILFLNFSHRFWILILDDESWLFFLTCLNQCLRASGHTKTIPKLSCQTPALQPVHPYQFLATVSSFPLIFYSSYTPTLYLGPYQAIMQIFYSCLL